jgi:hypothetical protein
MTNTFRKKFESIRRKCAVTGIDVDAFRPSAYIPKKRADTSCILHNGLLLRLPPSFIRQGLAVPHLEYIEGFRHSLECR